MGTAEHLIHHRKVTILMYNLQISSQQFISRITYIIFLYLFDFSVR